VEYISYAVGCMFGRYSLDEKGLAFAGGDFDPSLYKTFPADENNVISTSMTASKSTTPNWANC